MCAHYRMARQAGRIGLGGWSGLEGGRMWILELDELWRKVLGLYHNSLVTGHLGTSRTLELVARSYWQRNMTNWVMCDEIGVRLTVIQHSDRAWYEPTVGAWYMLVLLAGRRVLLGAYLQAPSQEVLQCWKVG